MSDLFKQHIESACGLLHQGVPVSDELLASIAISLKRIADMRCDGDMQRRDETAREIERAVAAERERIAGWIDCAKDCHHATASGGCHRVDDFCARYVADCIRRGCRP